MFIKQSDLFDNGVYLEEVCDVLCIALAELPALLALQDTVETLLHVKHGPTIICWILANSPDYFREGIFFKIYKLKLFLISYCFLKFKFKVILLT